MKSVFKIAKDREVEGLYAVLNKDGDLRIKPLINSRIDTLWEDHINVKKIKCKRHNIEISIGVSDHLGKEKFKNKIILNEIEMKIESEK